MAGAALDMSLDDIIKNNKKSGAPNPRSRQRNSGSGPTRRQPSNRRSNRSAPYTDAHMSLEAPDSAWRHDLFETDVAAAAAYPGRPTSIETGTKLYVSNLDYGVSNDDIKELFSEVGNVKRHSIHYDRSGRSKGVAEVVYSRRSEALEAVKKYNNVQLDGKPMKIELVTSPSAAPLTTNSIHGKQNGAPKSRSEGRNGGSGQSRRSNRKGQRRRGGPKPAKAGGEKVSAEDLDADLDKYHSEAMQVS